MFNTLKSLEKEYNIPYNTLNDWKKSDSYRREILEKLDIFLELKKEAIKKIKEIFNETELNVLLVAIFQNDIETPICFYSLQECIEEALLYSDADIKIIEIIKLKLKELCNFQFYILTELSLEFFRQEEN